MASNSNNKNFQEPSDGTQNWGAILNSNFSIVDSAFGNSSTVTLSNGANVTLTTAQFQSARIVLSGTVTTTATVTIPSDIGGGSTSGSYWLFSNGTGGTITVTTGGSNNVVINPVPTGSSAPYRNVYIFSDGSNIYSLDQASSLAVNEGGTGLSTLIGANNALYSTSATALTAGTLPVAAGGTGISTAPTNGQIDIGNGTNFTRTTLTAGTGVTVTNGAGSITLAAAGNILNYQDFTTSGTWTAPSGLTGNEIVTGFIWGAGGGGGGGNSEYSGGGGGGCFQFTFLASQVGSSQTVTIGAGGAGGFSGTAATAGGTTSFGSLVSVTGGTAGGNAGSGGVSGGNGGSLSGYAVAPWIGVSGGQSTPSPAAYGGGGGAGTSSGTGVAGGNSVYGGGGGGGGGSYGNGNGGTSMSGGAGGAAKAATGTAGTAPGGGGGGGGTTGGAGARGEIRVWVIRQTTG